MVKGADTSVGIRLATPADTVGIVTMHAETLCSTYPLGTVGISQEAMWREYSSRNPIEDRIRWWGEIICTMGDAHIVYVAADRGTDEIYGYTRAQIEVDGRRRLAAAYVSVEEQRRYLGSRLVNAALRWHGPYQDVSLEVGAHQKNIQLFYERLGFKPTGKRVTNLEPPEPGRVYFNNIEMVRPSRRLFVNHHAVNDLPGYGDPMLQPPPSDIRYPVRSQLILTDSATFLCWA